MSNTEADKLGIRIGGSAQTGVSAEDLQKLQDFRETFQHPIAQVFSFLLETARGIDPHCVVTYRIKRLDTIIEKLQRFFGNENGKMRLSRMWDIAGCRCILSDCSPEKMYQVLDAVKARYGENCKVNDYVATPRSSGYRSIHIYVKEGETGKPVEIQIRNRKLHNWSTLVEIIDVLFGSAVKEQGAKGNLGEFLLLFSRRENLSSEEFSQLLNIEKEMGIFGRMSDTLAHNYLNVRMQWLHRQAGGSYFVIDANKERSVIESYPTFQEAEKVYYDKYLNNKNSNIVLTHIPDPSFEDINMAYSNYVLSMHAFFDEYRNFVSERIIRQINGDSYLLIRRDFANYLENLECHLKNLQQEYASVLGLKGPEHAAYAAEILQWENELDEKTARWKQDVGDFVMSLIMTADRDLFSDEFIKDQLRSINRMISEV